MKTRLLVAVLGLMVCEGSLFADQYHYNNVIIGDRAMGLGGAYTAIADDASGVYYNPAGLGFALSNDISGSANAFYTKSAKYKNTIGNKAFEEKSAGSMAPFFGGLQKLDNIMPGLVAAFGIASLDSELKDQNDLYSGMNFSIEQTKGVKGTAYLERLHRTVTHRASTNLFTAGLAKRITGSFAMGLSLGYLAVDELTQEYQDIRVKTSPDAFRTTQTIQNLRQYLNAGALDIGLGMQWAFANSWSVGLTLKKPINLFQSLNHDLEQYNYYNTLQCSYTDVDGKKRSGEVGKTCETAEAEGIVPAGATEKSNTEIFVVQRTDGETKLKKPIGDWPAEVRAGIAWFASPRYLVSFDVTHKTESTNGELVKREAVTNFALGNEFYITPSIPMRLGLFTNFDARPDVKKGKSSQPDHVDYYGASLFFAWAQPNSQVALGTVVQSGEGKAQKMGSYDIQDVEAFSGTLAFSATHNF